jgi:S1-C subfamily serine protease
VNYAGDLVFQQFDFSSSPSGAVTVIRMSDFEKGTGGTYGEHTDTDMLSQCQESSFWVGGGRVFVGNPPKAIQVGPATASSTRYGDQPPRHTAMDQTQKRLYVVTENQALAFGMSMTTPAAGATAVSFPKVTVEKDAQALYRWTNEHSALAATLDGTTYLVVPGRQVGVVMRAGLRFDAPAAVAAAGTPASGGSGEDFPEKAVEGVAVTVRLVPKGTTATFTVVNGPKGMAISPDGMLTWTPDATQVGAQQAKIKIEVGGDVSFKRFACEVLPKDAAKAAGDAEKLALVGKHPLVMDRYDLSLGVDRKVILLQDRTLSLIDGNGQVAEPVELPSSYRFVRERARHWVAIADDRVDILDKKTLAVKRTVALGGRAVNCAALHPKQPLTYLSVDYGKQQHDIQRMTIVVVDEEAGTLTKPDKVYGNMIAVHPAGTALYTAVKDLISSDFTLIGMYGDFATYSEYTDIDLLLSYDLSGKSARLRHYNPSPGANGYAVLVSPDGKWVSYVAGGGYRKGEGTAKYGYTVPAFTADDVRKATVSFDTGAYPTAAAYHPSLPLVAATDGHRPMVYDLKTGEQLADKLDLGDAKITQVSNLLFAPCGQHLLVAMTAEDGRKMLRAFPLRLTDAERAQCKSAPAVSAISPSPSTPASPAAGAKPAQAVALSEFDALQPATASPDITPAEIAKRWEPSVVMIENAEGSATGFFVGKNGYVLTCAHALAGRTDRLTVRFKLRQGESTVQLKDDHPTVIASDEQLDLAVLRIKAPGTVQAVRLPLTGGAAMGDRVCIIGNPGGGGRVLDSTMTEGLVSNPHRDLDGQDYVQTSAAINPGSSGSPLFDTKGRVIGLVVLKAMDAEAAGFAVPRERLVRFLRLVAGVDKN